MRLLLLLPLLPSLALAQTTAWAPVEGDRADLDRLAGEWVGGYSCEETGRHGTVVLRLAAGADSVEATVLMVPRATEDVPAPTAIPLTVHHVTVAGRSFRGTLAPYDDPEWGIPLETAFGGTLASDDHIEGYFHAEGTQIDTVPQCGRWWATRTSDRETL